MQGWETIYSQKAQNEYKAEMAVFTTDAYLVSMTSLFSIADAVTPATTAENSSVADSNIYVLRSTLLVASAVWARLE